MTRMIYSRTVTKVVCHGGGDIKYFNIVHSKFLMEALLDLWQLQCQYSFEYCKEPSASLSH